MIKHITLIIFIVFTYLSSAQTTGPTQPEAAGFAPIGADDMVNLYTGDFNYNIPLMVIPGPDGGYPINAFYNSNVGMDQAASWIGLGWNLNAGAIQRNLRGTPDDFKGDLITKEFYTKPSTTISFDFRSPLVKKIYKKEFAGLDLEKAIALNLNGKYTIYYNNYSGLGINTSLGTTLSQLDDSENVDGFTAGLGLSFGSQEGFSLSPNLSYDWRNEKTTEFVEKGISRTLATGFNINSKQGFNDLNLSFKNKLIKTLKKEEAKSIFKAWNYDLSFASTAPLAGIKSTRFSTTANFSLTTDKIKKILVLDDEKVTLSGSFSRSWVTGQTKEIQSFGAMYMASKNEDAISDFYRENEGPITKDDVLTSIPVLSYDIFSIQGHGVGGSFRAYQNSIGKLSDAKNRSTSVTVGLGLEIGSGATSQKVGVDINAALAGSNSGPWKNPSFYYNELYNYNFNNKTTAKPLFEPFYFKMIGEASAMDTTVWNQFEEGNPIAFDINLRWDTSILAAKAQAHSAYNRSGNVFEGKENEVRNPRTQNIEYFTKKDINGVYTTPHVVIDAQLVSIAYDNGQDHHLNGISVLKPNGVRYNYFLPAYNHTTEKVTFAIPGEARFYKGRYYPKESNPKVIDKVLGKNGIKNVEFYAAPNNGAGEDEFYSKEIIPAYAHTYFITSILSQDYVDIKNDGPTEDDLGTYIKMNYEKVADYKWRFPFDGAYYSKGYLDNFEDDKASYQEGKKDLFYVKSIETKTHVAVFETKDSKLYDADQNTTQKELVSISLYSKADPNWTRQFYLNTASSNWPTPIQTVHLNQDYSLKKGVPNSSAKKMVPALKELYFTYQNSTKGENAKYQFDYGNNPDFESHQQDRWGAYQTDKPNVQVNENPYTYQEENYANRDDEASAWLMDKITLPSKGAIKVDYEKDDYAYVQDKKAMSFIELIGTGKKSTDTPRTQMKKDDSFLFFKSPYKLTSHNDVRKMIEGMDHIRFRVYMQLKFADKWKKTAYDYVEGYAEIESAGMKDSNTGYVQIKPIKPKTGSSFINPIRLATFQYIRKSRPDLGIDFGDISNITPQAFGTRNLLAMLNEASVLVTGYYRTALIKGWAPSMSLEKPSYIRLINPNRKYGGGARVEKITLKSDESDAREFGQTYHYTLKDGKSSGVAEWEPILGIEENPFTQPIWYNANNNGHKIIFSNEQSFSEEPLGAGLYPSASVGYSKVTVKNLENKDVAYAQSGINVSEFYTAKDFPTKADRSGALFAPYWAPVPIPFIGEQNTRYNGYSMGYSFTLNNAIYGRPKTVATYPYNEGEPTGEPIQKSVYKYKTLSSNSKALDNKVTTLIKEGVKKEVYMGKEIDFYIDEIEANTFSIGLGSQFNLNVQFPAFLPSWFPSINTGRKGTRYLTTNKIVYNTPILDSIIQYKDGAKVSTKNLIFDHETGEPIVTSVTNEWKQPIYTYNFPAHWSYDQMKGAYKNYRAQLVLKQNSTSPNYYQLFWKHVVNNNITSPIVNYYPLNTSVANILFEGDLIRTFSNGNYYVEEIDNVNNQFKLKNRNNASATFLIDEGSILSSGFKNLQSTKKGKIVSLKDYSNIQNNSIGTAGWDLILNYYNQQKSNFRYFGPPQVLTGNISLESCNRVESLTTKIDVKNVSPSDPNYNKDKPYVVYFYIKFARPNSQQIYCEEKVLLGYTKDKTGFPFTKLSIDKFEYNSSLSNNNIITLDYVGSLFQLPINTRTFSGLILNNCEFACDKQSITILHADATEFSDVWDFNYSELEDQSTDLSSSLSDIANNSSLGNPYAFGLKGVWRPKRTSAYLIDRLQTGSYGDGLRIDKDGEYQEFYWFDWTQPISYNEDYNWRWVNEVTKYNVNGASKEGKNRLDIHAASLFGYNNHLVTASASNSKTTDIAFDGFEDYKSGQSGTEGDLNFIIANVDGGNLDFNQIGSSNNNLVLWESGHTGNYSLNITAEVPESQNIYWEYKVNSNSTQDKFVPEKGKEYYLSFWTKTFPNKNGVRIPDASNVDSYLPRTKIDAVCDNTTLSSFIVNNVSNPIEGWYKVEGTFKIPSSYSQFELRIYHLNDRVHVIDDIRIQPFNSGMETYVYDPSNYRLRATLSNQNYATFYNYDEEGNLTQTKVETERGIKTISTNRNNIKQ